MKKILYVDMDNVLVDFTSGIEQLDTSVTQQFDGRLDEVPGVFSLMSPMPSAIEAFRELSELFDTYILSTAQRDENFIQVEGRVAELILSRLNS